MKPASCLLVAALALLPWVARQGWVTLEESKADCVEVESVRELEA